MICHLHPIVAGTYLTVYTLFYTTIAFHVENSSSTVQAHMYNLQWIILQNVVSMEH